MSRPALRRAAAGGLVSWLLVLAPIAATPPFSSASTPRWSPTSGSTSSLSSAQEVALTGRAALRAESRTERLRQLVRSLTVAAEDREGYLREKFTHWTDSDSDCLDTRGEVLSAESRTEPLIADCRVVAGTWFSYYDRASTTDPSSLDIDHLVPLAEAWDSGARTWDTQTRTRFANDTSPRSLMAVTASSNRSKSDSDPAQWLPSYSRCRYLGEWVATKTRWALSVDAPEKSTLRARASRCPNKTLTVHLAPIGYADNEPDDGVEDTVRGLRVREIVYDPPGPDSDPNAETVLILNSGSTPAQLSGTSLRDGAGHLFVFPDLVLPPGSSVLVRSGAGTNDETSDPALVYAGWGSVWNNTGDSFELRDASGALIDSGSYTDTDTSDAHGTATFDRNGTE